MSIGGISGDWRHGTNAAASTLSNYTTKIHSVDFPLERDMVETTKFGSASRTFEPGLKQGTITVEYETTNADLIELSTCWNNGTSLSFQWSPDGTTTGKAKWTGSMYAQNVASPQSVGEHLKFTVTFQISGATTLSTHS